MILNIVTGTYSILLGISLIIFWIIVFYKREAQKYITLPLERYFHIIAEFIGFVKFRKSIDSDTYYLFPGTKKDIVSAMEAIECRKFYTFGDFKFNTSLDELERVCYRLLFHINNYEFFTITNDVTCQVWRSSVNNKPKPICTNENKTHALLLAIASTIKEIS